MRSPRFLIWTLAIAAPMVSFAAPPRSPDAMDRHSAASQGDLYGLDFEARFTPYRDRVAVRAEARMAAPHFKNESAPPSMDTPSRTNREVVRTEAAAAQRARQIPVGNLG